MNEIIAIGQGTWRKVLGMRVIYFLVFCGLFLTANMANYDILSIGGEKALVIDMSLTVNTIALILIALSMAFEIPKELNQGAAATLLTKPLGRTQYLLGKLLGGTVVGVVFTGLTLIGAIILLNVLLGEEVTTNILNSHLLMISSIIPMCAICILCGIALPESIAPFVATAIIFVAFITQGLSGLPVLYGGIIPDFDLFNIKAHASFETVVYPWSYVGLTALWGIIYSAFIMTIASMTFSNKDV